MTSNGRVYCRVVLCSLLLVLSAAFRVAAGPQSCEDLASFKLLDTTITGATLVPAGEFIPSSGRSSDVPASLARAIQVPAFCRVQMTVSPSIRIEVWMPLDGWNGDFEAVGEGGYAGNIAFAAMGTALRRGYSTASTDTGHVGGTADFALGHPELVVDFAYRANHEMTLKAKLVIQAFYHRGPKHSYFTGCSQGGRQGLTEAQRYPEDYDGVVAGAPGIYHTALAVREIGLALATLKDNESYIPATKLQAIQTASVPACDAIDGLTDGLIDDPRKCHFDPSVLLCKGEDSDNCLTAKQVETLKKIYSGTYDAQGKLIYPGRFPGAEAGWVNFLTGTAPFKASSVTSGISYMRNVVFDDPHWDFRTWDFARDLPRVESDIKDNSILDSADPNLAPFRDHGGKVIIYQGWSDESVSPLATIQYYKNVVATVTRIGTADSEAYSSETAEFYRATTEAGDFVRLFMVPGMDHCSRGTGPNIFDTTEAISNWVEGHKSPDRIIASHETSGVVDRTRPLCPYPLTAQYSGKGSIDDAANFACKVRR